MVFSVPLAAFQAVPTVGNAGLAQKATALLRRSCFPCHGLGGAAKANIFVLDRAKLVARKAIVPGNLNSRLLQVVESGEMPQGGKPLTDSDIGVLRDWIAAGAPTLGESAPSVSRPFLSNAEIGRIIVKDLRNTDERYQKYQRFYSIAHLYNANLPEPELELYRVALAKLIKQSFVEPSNCKAGSSRPGTDHLPN